jgi:hypothetical protein
MIKMKNIKNTQMATPLEKVFQTIRSVSKENRYTTHESSSYMSGIYEVFPITVYSQNKSITFTVRIGAGNGIAEFASEIPCGIGKTIYPPIYPRKLQEVMDYVREQIQLIH